MFFGILLAGIALSVSNIVLSAVNTPGIIITKNGIQLTNAFIVASIQKQFLSSVTNQSLLIAILIILVFDRYDNAKFRKNLLIGGK